MWGTELSLVFLSRSRKKDRWLQKMKHLKPLAWTSSGTDCAQNSVEFFVVHLGEAQVLHRLSLEKDNAIQERWRRELWSLLVPTKFWLFFMQIIKKKIFVFSFKTCSIPSLLTPSGNQTMSSASSACWLLFVQMAFFSFFSFFPHYPLMTGGETSLWSVKLPQYCSSLS